MNRGTLFASLMALVGCMLAPACQRPIDPQQLALLDSLTTTVEAAALTLNELDTERYEMADSLYKSTLPLFLRRFSDTLDRPTALALGEQFIQLRGSANMARDHQAVHERVDRAVIRLHALRTDLASGAIDSEAGAKAIQSERAEAIQTDSLVHVVIANYKATQRVLARTNIMDSLLEPAKIHATNR